MCRAALEKFDMVPCSTYAVNRLPVKEAEKAGFWTLHSAAYRRCFHPECMSETAVMNKASIAVAALLANCEMEEGSNSVVCTNDCKSSRLLFDLTQCVMVAVENLPSAQAAQFWRVINRTDRQCMSA